jgi:rhomboid protease GluP
MSQKTKTISASEFDKESLYALAYGTFESLGWKINYAGEKSIVAYTPLSRNKYANEIAVEAISGQLTVTSKMIHGELFDILGRNKKFVEKFIQTFETIKLSAGEELINGWKEKIDALKEETIKVPQEEIKQVAEAKLIMNFSTNSLYATYGLIGINGLIFIAMIVSGISIVTPTGYDIVRWGGNYSPLTLSGEWWRLISCMFVHAGIIHILFNMYALLIIGIYLEPMLGKTRYLTAYFCTGVFASLTSLWWHKTPIVSAGASGAIFGMYGVFLALLSTNLIPKKIRDGLLKSIAIFIGYNLLYGMKSGVDNSAHIGGLLSGLVIGYIYYYLLKEKAITAKTQAISFLIGTGTIIISIFVLKGFQENFISQNEAEKYQQVINRLMSSQKETEEIEKQSNALSFYLEKRIEKIFSENEIKNGLKSFYQMLNDFYPTEEKLLRVYDSSNTVTINKYIEQLKENIEEWNRGEQLFKSAASYGLSRSLHNFRIAFERYCTLYKRKSQILIKIFTERATEFNGELSQIESELHEIASQIKYDSF